jgi:hypothetical protein
MYDVPDAPNPSILSCKYPLSKNGWPNCCFGTGWSVDLAKNYNLETLDDNKEVLPLSQFMVF